MPMNIFVGKELAFSLPLPLFPSFLFEARVAVCVCVWDVLDIKNC